MIEIEFSALARQCLSRHIRSMAELACEVLAFLTERIAKGIKIDWQFSIHNAQVKLNSHYVKVHFGNLNFQKA
jgi:hypothetical protein